MLYWKNNNTILRTLHCYNYVREFAKNKFNVDSPSFSEKDVGVTYDINFFINYANSLGFITHNSASDLIPDDIVLTHNRGVFKRAGLVTQSYDIEYFEEGTGKLVGSQSMFIKNDKVLVLRYGIGS